MIVRLAPPTLSLCVTALALLAAAPAFSSGSNGNLPAAKERFQALCKKSGERISRTVDGVEGIALLNLRPSNVKDAGQYEMSDPYGRNCGGKDCIALHLFDYKMIPTSPGSTSLSPSQPRLYMYVEVIDSSTSPSKRIRFTKASPTSPLLQSAAPVESPRYGVMWEDISTKEDRELWIAGGSIKIVDLHTKEVIAERIGYLMDPGQGDTRGFRSPWLWARSRTSGCPSVTDHNQAFVTKVLRPIPEKVPR